MILYHQSVVKARRELRQWNYVRAVGCINPSISQYVGYGHSVHADSPKASQCLDHSIHLDDS